ncbi:MAG: translation initiation factor IF-3 [Parcubacteria group bacterium CG1_02_42_13]|uniref:Translation initiation factor IF-3 n=1 Tax=Candidatus Colwellbacteria bacterium CG23_combo_of_CG06-09_8_20_14_all_42_19 TaxID=1974541 RepID=A0A2H0ALP0_9BACT|nr:MAG: translation initiation factor IF-3 [Parcubacteria group bacterium CG1_02_42_13]PIP46287.1 MAG: translation initiation factor IF-3 [Candidatus Colwellbacteria bacterium CG23_combo_of_CG06-09_8_20_14_all_42_19]
MQEFRTNNQITAPELRVVDENGGNLGVMPLKEALAAAIAKGLDLILIVPNASPPVAKITRFDKFRYEKEKEWKKQRQAQKALEMKQIQISVREAKNDLSTKIRKLEKFLGAGHKVEIVMTLRGREKGMKDFAKIKLEEFLKMITVDHNIAQEIKPGGRGLAVQVIKK